MAVYTVLIVDTANADRSSICGLAAVVVDDGRVIHKYCQLINPEVCLDRLNASQHGIIESRSNSDTALSDVLPAFLAVIQDTLVVTQDPFGRVGLSRAALAAGIQIPSLEWIDSRRLVRGAWRETSGSGRKSLRSIAGRLQFNIRWHDPLNRALTMASVVETALQAGGLCGDPRLLDAGHDARDETVVFTGAFQTSADTIRESTIGSGMTVATHVTPETTIVCVGGRDWANSIDKKSAEQSRAEALIGEGCEISIVAEADLLGYLGVEPVSGVHPSTTSHVAEAEPELSGSWMVTSGRPLV